jgi:hypothetical protein
MPQDPSSAVVAALSVYVEPLVADARVAVLGDVDLGLHAQLFELGARSVHLYDPDPERVARTTDEVPRGVAVRMLRDDFDVRDGAFDLVVIPDLAILPDPSGTIVRLRRVVDARGTVVAMGRARTNQSDESLFPELLPAVVEYAELYDYFALQFESVTMTGVLPFAGVVFAELGAGDDLAVSVDTRLVDPEPPGVFVVVAGREDTALDPYAIVQVARDSRADQEPTGDTIAVVTSAAVVEVLEVVEIIQEDPRLGEATAAFAAMQLKAELLSAQLDEHRERIGAVENRSAGHEARANQLLDERDVALARASQLEGIALATEQALGNLERHVVVTERALRDRDEQIGRLDAELDSHKRSAALLAAEMAVELAAPELIAPELVAEILGRAEQAEASLALHVADLAQVSDAHADETAALEAQLRERARVIAEMERELGRREQLVRELVTSLEEAGSGGGSPVQFEAAPVVPGVAPEEVARLRRKLDDLALEVARREGELQARAWRITELENEQARLVARPTTPSPAPAPAPAPAPPPGKGGASTAASSDADRELARARDELDVLRQALTQEHAARLAAESGEELTRARAELAQQAALLEQMRGRGAHADG